MHNYMSILKIHGLSFLFILLLFSCRNHQTTESSLTDIFPHVADTAGQKAELEKILAWLPPDRTTNGRVSFLDETFTDWLERTGELPPEFDKMPSVPFLPDPLILDEGGRNIPVKTKSQWKEKREWMKKQLEYYITGTYPPQPENMKSVIVSEKKDKETVLQIIELTFGPDNRAKLTLELMIPPGEGPFPVFLTQWNHREWAQIAVRRGYIGCVYAGADSKDDTEEYSEIWAGRYDFTRLMRRAYGASRAIDYLYTLPFVDRDKIGISGHSRNGKLSLIAAAFDERIGACIPSSGGTGAEVPWRFCSCNYDVEDIALLACAQPAWLHPRLRFFTGRENKLPVDQNLFMALVAPRGLMLSTAISEGASNPWGIEQAYHATGKVYEFLGAPDNLAVRSRYGLHSICARDMEDYMDFFDYVFKRSSHKPENRLFYNYSFEDWCRLSGVKINPRNFPPGGIEDLLTDTGNKTISSIGKWESKREGIRKSIQWLSGEEPPGVTNPGPGSLSRGGRGESNFGSFLQRPGATADMGVMAISPYNGFGDQLFGYLYYPLDKNGNPKNNNLPVVIYLHEYDYSKGFNSYHQIDSFFRLLCEKGYAVFAFDMIGFGNRIEEGTRFYHRYPRWSIMGKMVADTRGAVDALANLDFTDSSGIYVAGYSLGATVALHSAALDERIAGVVSVAGFTPMRLNTPDRGTEGIKAYSHLHGLLPGLGYFTGNESRIPYDYHEVLAAIAPRPVLIIAPLQDKDAHWEDVQRCVKQAGKIYSLYDASGNIEIFSPDDYSRFSEEMRDSTCSWLLKRQISHSH
jgi:cephalosporin-C deacetylase-like acetyl esterase